MTDLPQLARLDQLPRKPDGRHEAIVEAAHVLDAGGRDLLPDVVALGRVAPERFLADHVLAGLSGGDRRLGVQRVRAAVVEEADPVVLDQLAPVAGRVLVAVPARRLADRLGVAPGDADEPRLERRRPRDVRDLLERIRVRLAHERVAEHANTDLTHFAIVRIWRAPVKWGIISTADINRKVIPGAHASPKVDLVAVASRDQARADAYAKEWEIERAYGSYEALLADPEIEAVYISLPNTMHCEWSIKALEAGKHVLCEKPLSRHPDEVAAAFDTADRTGRLLSEAFMYRHNPQTKRLSRAGRRRRDRRVAPDPLHVQLRPLRRVEHPPAHRRRRRRADGRRLLHVSGSRLLGGEPERVFGEAWFGPSGTDWVFTGTLRFPGDVLATSTAARRSRTATSSRRSAAKAPSSSTTRGTAMSR